MTETASEYLRRVNEEYRRLAGEFRAVAREAAQAEADHKAKRAQKVLTFKDAQPNMSHAEATTRAESDPAIAELYQKRLITAALADSMKEKLRQLKEEVPSARTDVVNERGADEFHSRGYGGTP